jgi:hypothetical protein
MDAGPSDPISISLVPPSDTGRIASARSSGSGRPDDPLRAAMLLRHADWSGRSDRAEFASQVMDVSDAAFSGLMQIKGGSTLAETSGALVGVLERANRQAVQLDAYFSGVVVFGRGAQLAAASIGHVTAWWRKPDAVTALLTPTLLEVGAITTSALTGAIGIGFAADKVQRFAVRVGPSDDVVILLATQKVTAPLIESAQKQGRNDLRTLLENLTEVLPEQPPIAALIRLQG